MSGPRSQTDLVKGIQNNAQQRARNDWELFRKTGLLIHSFIVNESESNRYFKRQLSQATVVLRNAKRTKYYAGTDVDSIRFSNDRANRDFQRAMPQGGISADGRIGAEVQRIQRAYEVAIDHLTRIINSTGLGPELARRFQEEVAPQFGGGSRVDRAQARTTP